MSDSTFGLTQVNENSRHRLPSLATARNYSTISDEDAPLSSEGSGKMYRSTGALVKVSDKLNKVQEDVRSSFDLLYTSRRNRLLPKAMELERSDSVKDQLRSLESKVVSLLKTYNDLQNRRRAKDQMLLHLNKELTSIVNRELDLTPANMLAEEVSRKYEYAVRQMEREYDYTEVLEHMLVECGKAINRKVQPIYGLRKELQQLKLRFHENEVDYLRVAMESKSVKHSIRKSAEQFDQQRTHHAHRVQEKILHFKRRAEFVEFVQRQDSQKHLESKIHENERETMKMETARKAAETVEQLQDASKGHIEALQEYERHTEKLSRAAHTSSIQQVIEYWKYLQDFGTGLEAKMETGNARITELREEFQTLRSERTQVRLLLTSEYDVSPAQLEKLRDQLQGKETQVEEMATRVRNRQLEVWQRAVASVIGRLESLLLAAGGELTDLPIQALLQKTEEQLGILYSNRTIGTPKSSH